MVTSGPTRGPGIDNAMMQPVRCRWLPCGQEVGRFLIEVGGVADVGGAMHMVFSALCTLDMPLFLLVPPVAPLREAASGLTS